MCLSDILPPYLKALTQMKYNADALKHNNHTIYNVPVIKRHARNHKPFSLPFYEFWKQPITEQL